MKEKQELETITRKEANKLVISDIQQNLRVAGMLQLANVLGTRVLTEDSIYSSVSSAETLLVKIVAGTVLAVGIGGTIGFLADAHGKVEKYIKNPTSYIEEKYSKKLVDEK